MKYNVYKISYFNRHETHQLVKSNLTEGEVNKFIDDEASRLNYGLYRYWEVNGEKFYDCGSITYIVKIVDQNVKISC